MDEAVVVVGGVTAVAMVLAFTITLMIFGTGRRS